MRDATAALARSITWAGSKQTYLTARLLVDKDLLDDCYRAYAYFRWADDIIDADLPDGASYRARDRRIAFIQRQKELIDRLYRDERPGGLTPEEKMVAVLIANDRRRNSGLESYFRNFLAVLEFDAYRRGRRIRQVELAWYSQRLAMAVTDCIQYFIGWGHPYPATDNRNQAVLAAHITHMLRDMVLDLSEGYFNIPGEYLEAHGITPWDLESRPFRAWVGERVALARRCLRQGKRYLDELDVVRCKVAGFWYCARYEGVLDTIERDGYVLRPGYRRGRFAWLKIAWLGASIPLRHLLGQTLRDVKRALSDSPAKPVITKQQRRV